MYVVIFFFNDRQVILLLSPTLSNKTCGKLIFPARAVLIFCHDLYHLTNEATVKKKCNFWIPFSNSALEENIVIPKLLFAYINYMYFHLKMYIVWH